MAYDAGESWLAAHALIPQLERALLTIGSRRVVTQFGFAMGAERLRPPLQEGALRNAWGEVGNVVVHLVLGLIALFVAYGRLIRVPITG